MKTALKGVPEILLKPPGGVVSATVSGDGEGWWILVRCRTGSRSPRRFVDPLTGNEGGRSKQDEMRGSSCSDQAPKPRPRGRLPDPYGPRTRYAGGTAAHHCRVRADRLGAGAPRKAAELGLAAHGTPQPPTPEIIAEIQTLASALRRRGVEMAQLRAQREYALEAMQALQRFNPALVGPVAEGWRMPAAKSASS